MKRKYLFVFMTMLLLVSCSTDDRTSDYVAGCKLTLNATLPNSGTRVNEAVSDTYGLVTNWSDDDSLDVLVSTSSVVSMIKSVGNMFTSTTDNSTIASGFNVGSIIYGVGNKYNDKITTASNGNQLKATIDFTDQNGTISNLAKYDMVYGKGDPTGSIMFNHKICVLRLDITSDLLQSDSITKITAVKLQYVPSSGSKLFATKEIYNFGTTSDSTITDVDTLSLLNVNIPVSNGKGTIYVAIPQRLNLYGNLYLHLGGYAGSVYKQYDLTNAIRLSNKIFPMSTVQSKTITNFSQSPKIGEYLFSDGTWGTLANNSLKTPIAVIFSETTSITDQGYGWSHGYAMALKDASTECNWHAVNGTCNPTGVLSSNKGSWEAEIADKDGYTYTQCINNSSYPAGYAAATTYSTMVTPPSTTSGWYLPSCGQWYDILVNIGGMSSNYSTSSTFYLSWWYQTSTCANNINTYLTPCGSYDSFSIGPYYWSSSEYDNLSAYDVRFDSDGIFLYTVEKYTLSITHSVRSVIAF